MWHTYYRQLQWNELIALLEIMTSRQVALAAPQAAGRGPYRPRPAAARIQRQALVTHPPLDLALVAWLPRRTRIDMKVQHRRVATITRMDHPPGASTVRDAGSLVVDPHRRRDAAKPPERRRVAPEPGQHRLALGPDDRFTPAVR